jgi:hypothetical protein
MNAYEAFLNRCKPSFFCANEYEPTEYNHLLSCGYPFVDVRPGIATLFFQNEELKEEFLIKSRDLDFDEPEFKKVLGEALGYPPVAAQYYADWMQDRSVEKYHVDVQYAGRRFAGHIDDAESIAQWLWSNVPIPPTEVKFDHHGRKFSMFPPKENVV